MRHLDEAALALLADHPPSAEEQAHLDRCAQCAGRVERYRWQTTALRALPDRAAPDAVLQGLSARLGDAVVVREIAPASRTATRRVWLRRAGQLAAALVLFSAGAWVGSRRNAGTGAVVSEQARTQTLVQVDSMTPSADPDRTIDALTRRVAALEALVLTAEAALADAPADPVIRAHYVDVRRDRDLLRRQVPVVSSEARWF